MKVLSNSLSPDTRPTSIVIYNKINHMTQIPNRRQRRQMLKYQGILKAKSKASLKEWAEYVRENIKAGKEIHAANVDRAISAQGEEQDQKEANG